MFKGGICNKPRFAHLRCSVPRLVYNFCPPQGALEKQVTFANTTGQLLIDDQNAVGCSVTEEEADVFLRVWDRLHGEADRKWAEAWLIKKGLIPKEPPPVG